ncbi:MAG: CHAT domain-containing protein [Methanomethylovorans sp.]|nr:CHAT domain-containing protein [Methanomethylovorans sp.]
MVVLSACESGKAASDALTHGLAQRLSAQGIPHVIGMRESIHDIAGRLFEIALCDDLAGQERVDAALQSARIAIQNPFRDIPRHETDLENIAELSLGQWSLPMLLSPDPAIPIINWDFEPKENGKILIGKSLSSISLPAKFLGRRAELRKYKNKIAKGEIQKLLITGPGGQGKTSLAGKLALNMQARGHRVFAWSTQVDVPWRNFEFEMELSLDEERAKRYDHFRMRFEDETDRAQFLIELLMEQFNGKLILFIDNLETLQNPNTFHIQDDTIAGWVRAAQLIEGLTLILTSRWQLPNWIGEHLPLTRSTYGDFLRMTQELIVQKQMQSSIMSSRDRFCQVYEALGGNGRGLEFFAAATLTMDNAEEEAFLAQLENTKRELQDNMAIEAIYTQLPEDARIFLGRLPAFVVLVPSEGLQKLGLDLAEHPETLLQRLLVVSFLEAQYDPEYAVIQYQCTPMVVDWMRGQGSIDDDQVWLDIVADYHLYLRRYERRTLQQSIMTHHALQRAGRTSEADRLTLDHIVGPFTRAGFYATLLIEWLPPICGSSDADTRGEALGQTGKILIHIGQYDSALSYLKQSLAIRQQIGDKAGGRDHPQQYLGSLSCSGGLRDGPELPETIPGDQAANRRQSGNVPHFIQYGTFAYPKKAG